MDFGTKQRYENLRKADHEELVEQLNAFAEAEGSGENYDSSSPSEVVDAAIDAGLIDLQQMQADYVERHPEIDPDNPNPPKGLDTRPLDEVSNLELYSESFDDQLADEIGADSEAAADVVTQVEWALNTQYAEEKQFAKDTIEDRTDVDDVDGLSDDEIRKKFADEVEKIELGLEESPLPLETIAAHKKGTAIANLVEKGWDREDLDDLPPGDVVALDRLNYPPPQNPTAEAAGEADSIADLVPRGEAAPADSKPADGADGTEPTGTTNNGSAGGPTAVGESPASGVSIAGGDSPTGAGVGERTGGGTGEASGSAAGGSGNTPSQTGGASSASNGTVPDSASTAGGGSSSANDAASTSGSGSSSTQDSQPQDSGDSGETVNIVFTIQDMNDVNYHRSDDGRWFDGAGNQVTDPQELARLDTTYNNSNLEYSRIAVPGEEVPSGPPEGTVDTLDTTGKTHEEATAEEEQGSASNESDGDSSDEDDEDDDEGDGTGEAAESEAETGDEEQEGQNDEKSESETEAGTPTPDGAVAIDPADQARFDDSPFGAEQQQDQIDAIDAQSGVAGGPNDDPSGIDEEAFFGSPAGAEAAETRTDGIERKVDGGDTDPADIDAEESGGGPIIDLKVEGGGLTDPVEDEGSPAPSDFGEGAKGDPTGGIPIVPGGTALTGKTDGFGEPDGPDDPTDPEGSLITANLGGPTAESAETFRGQGGLDLDAVEGQQVDDIDVAIELAE